MHSTAQLPFIPPNNPDGWIDSHAHLDLVETAYTLELAQLSMPNQLAKQFTPTSALSLPNLEELNAILTISTQQHHAESLKRFSAPNIYRTVGVHPDHILQVAEWSWLECACGDTEVLAIGEIGLDNTIEVPMSAQISAVEQQIEIALSKNLPIVMHTREAERETLEVLARYPAARGAAHCFTGSLEFAQKLVEYGWYISFSGILTFKNAKTLHSIPQYIPESQLLVETDAPYLTPSPYRGKKINIPTYVKYTGQKLAELLGKKEKEMSKITRQNFWRLFSRSKSKTLL